MRKIWCTRLALRYNFTAFTWGWNSSGEGRRYFSFRAPTGSVTFRFSTLLDNNTEGYIPSRDTGRKEIAKSFAEVFKLYR